MNKPENRDKGGEETAGKRKRNMAVERDLDSQKHAQKREVPPQLKEDARRRNESGQVRGS